MKILCLFFLFSTLAFTEDYSSSKPKHTADRNFWLITAGQFTATVYDIETTRCFLHNPGWEESNPLLGKHPSDARVYGTLLLQAGLIAGAGYVLKGRKNFLNKVWWVPQAYATGMHVRAGSRNIINGGC